MVTKAMEIETMAKTNTSTLTVTSGVEWKLTISQSIYIHLSKVSCKKWQAFCPSLCVILDIVIDRFIQAVILTCKVCWKFFVVSNGALFFVIKLISHNRQLYWFLRSLVGNGCLSYVGSNKHKWYIWHIGESLVKYLQQFHIYCQKTDKLYLKPTQ